MAKHKHREQEPVMNDVNAKSSNNINNNPFGIDPMQLIGLLGGNFDMNNMGNMLASMNTNGFDLNNLGSLAQMVGLNLDNNFMQGNNKNNSSNNMNSNVNSNFNPNMNPYPNNSNNINNNSNMNASNINNKNANNNIKNANTNNSGKKVDSKNDKKSTNIKNDKKNDDNLQFLMSLRCYVHPDKIKFIDKIIELYNSGVFKDV